MKIFTKTFLYTLALLVMIALLASGLIYTLMPKVYTEQKQQELTLHTDAFVKSLESAKKDEIVSLMANYADILQANLNVQVGEEAYTMLTWDGGVITQIEDASAESDVVPGDADVQENTVENTTETYITSDYATQEGTANIAAAASSANSKTIEITRSFVMEGETGELTATATLAPVEEAVDVILSLLPISLFLCVAVAIVFSLLYARAITRPIKAISDETMRMNALDRNAKCEIATKDEFGMLAQNVNGLYKNLLCTIESLEAELKKVGAAEKAKTDFLRAASHELKTPVTAMNVIMDNMILGIGKYKNHAEWLPKCAALIGDLKVKLQDILDASCLEAVTESTVTESIEAICSGILEPYIMIARAKGLTLYIDWSSAFTVTVPPKLLGKALSNIFLNAVQYTTQQGRFAVYCKGSSLIVENECAPIPKDQLHRLYEPFYRPDASRSRETGGNGLGLYITDTVLRLLELDYGFEPMSSPDGMRFTICF